MAIRVQEAASVRLDEIYRYTRETWGEAQAETYITGLFAAFEQIETRGVHSRASGQNFPASYWASISDFRSGARIALNEREKCS
ncbi:type II toxin-antitoxin system RelE/ParE family toxin [Pukyongiella litopenaei]|uniref:type II toxin-antitoxin system RelE/ParE family toxin n=1 Tax=Pukyongiella litopenaei TaxID=2605946 RepID=UPI001FCEB873|nr:type II toxin-antitoxin system RelE/ParE family toxin [Pukyongiella litopenaei]